MRALALTLFTLATPVAAENLRLQTPVDCQLGESCFIQNYVDRDQSDGYKDFGCGSLSYDNHKGTDFALPDLRAMRKGVAVQAAAAGVVRATRDGMPDISIKDPAAPDIDGRECGNAVAITHADGWETQYCHLKRGSVVVKTGDQVRPGDTLGQIGLSGSTEFPHLHITVRKGGVVVDPFQPNGSKACRAADNALWLDDIDYIAGGFIGMGFSDQIPEYATIRDGSAHSAKMPSDAPALVVWGYIFGGVKGDEIHFTITGPDGTFHNHVVVLERTQVQLFRATGRRNSTGRLQPGFYLGQAKLIRDGVELASEVTKLEITR